MRHFIKLICLTFFLTVMTPVMAHLAHSGTPISPQSPPCMSEAAFLTENEGIISKSHRITGPELKGLLDNVHAFQARTGRPLWIADVFLVNRLKNDGFLIALFNEGCGLEDSFYELSEEQFRKSMKTYESETILRHFDPAT